MDVLNYQSRPPTCPQSPHAAFLAVESKGTYLNQIFKPPSYATSGSSKENRLGHWLSDGPLRLRGDLQTTLTPSPLGLWPDAYRSADQQTVFLFMVGFSNHSGTVPYMASSQLVSR